MHKVAKQYIRSRLQNRDGRPQRDDDRRGDYRRPEGDADWAMAPWMEAGRQYGGRMPWEQGRRYDEGYRGGPGAYPMDYRERPETGGYREDDRQAYPGYGQRGREVYVEGMAGRGGDDQWRVAGRMMMPHAERGGQMDKLDEHTAKEWVAGMQNADGTTGPHWSMEQTKQVAAQKSVDCDPLEFWVAMNMVYSDYFGVAKKFNINNTDFYVELAKAFLDDKDAGEGKLARYYEFVVR